MNKKYKVLGTGERPVVIDGVNYSTGDIVKLPADIAEIALSESKVELMYDQGDASEGIEHPEKEVPVNTSSDAGASASDENNGGESKEVLYKITNKETGEELEVKAHTFRDGFVDFADASLSEEEWKSPDVVLYSFANPEDKGELSSEEYDIEKIQG